MSVTVSRGDREPPAKQMKLQEEEEEETTSEIEYFATPSSLCSLPNEILIKILLYLDTRDKIRTKLVNRRMYGVVDDPILWQHVEIKDAYYKNIKSLLRISQPHAKSLYFSEGITMYTPFSHHCQSLVIGFKNVEELVLNGFDVTGRALQTLATGLPHLSSLTLSFTSTTSFNSTIEQIPSLRYLNKLSLYIGKSLSEMEYYTRLVDAWYDADCYPNSLYIFCYFSNLPQFSNPPSIPHNASLVFYFRYRRPLDLQFNLVPAFYLQLGPHKDQELVCTSNKSLSIKVMDCYSPEMNTKLRTCKVGVLSSNYPWGPALIGNAAAIPFCLSIGYNLAFLNFTCISYPFELSVDQLIDVLRFTPNLTELTLSGLHVYCKGDIIELIHALVQYCKFLKGLNLSICSFIDVDKLRLWRALSSISRLQYLTICVCSFSPPLTEAKRFIYEFDDLVKNQMCLIFKQMIMLKALHVNLICLRKAACSCMVQLLQRYLLNMISNMTNLHYLKLNIEFQIDHAYELCGLEDVLQNCTQLRVLYVHTHVLHLPSNPNLFANLTHLYISCANLSEDKFIDFKEDGKFSLKHFVLIASRISFPDLMKFLNSCAGLYTCHIALGKLPQRMQQTKIRSILSDICVTPFHFDQLCYDTNSFNEDNTDFDDLFCDGLMIYNYYI